MTDVISIDFDNIVFTELNTTRQFDRSSFWRLKQQVHVLMVGYSLWMKAVFTAESLVVILSLLFA